MKKKFKIALGLEYDGSLFCGWQKQRKGISIQATVEEALSRVAGQRIATYAAGRTDAGVHARAQVLHFETEADRSNRAWVLGSNTHLPHSISILWAREVKEDFHARIKALSRRYRYVIYNHSIRPSLLKNRVAWCYKNLEVDRMQNGVLFLIGEHDFTSFRDSQCQSLSPIREIKFIEIKRAGDLVVMDIEANAFLHHMVRNIAGVLMSVGAGELSPQDVKRILNARDRREACITAPASGLYLTQVTYPEEYEIPVTVHPHTKPDTEFIFE